MVLTWMQHLQAASQSAAEGALLSCSCNVGTNRWMTVLLGRMAPMVGYLMPSKVKFVLPIGTAT